MDWIRLGLGYVCCGEIGDEDRTFLKDLEFGGLFLGVGGLGSKFINRH